ncbi:preprotein translocase subunit SecG [bacterium]|nr:preprotein translocase subunit SecG [bacterium]
MYAFLIILHVLIALALIVAVLLQSGKGTGLAGAFGGGGGAMGAVFGGRGAATFLSKLTTIFAVAFFLSCLGHSLLVSRRFVPTRSSVLQQDVGRQPQQTQTAVPLVPLTPPPVQQSTGETEEGTAPAPSPEDAGGQ